MRYVFDNDLHIHSGLSSCSGDPEQTPARILKYAKDNGLKTVCLTDHFWDSPAVPGASGWYLPQDYPHICKALPLPQADGIRFLFGVETDMDRNCVIGISRETIDKLDFVIVPTTHLHMSGFTCRGDEDAAERGRLWISRFKALLDADLPFRKMGVAHLTCGLIFRGHHTEALDTITDAEMRELFAVASEKGLGIELNFPSLATPAEQMPSMLRPYLIAKSEGCKFYFGSDAHHPDALDAEKANAENIITLLGLEESDKFII